MAKRTPRRQHVRLKYRYPKHALSPEDLLHFIESTGFTRQWEALGLDAEEDLTALQLFIMSFPRGYPVIQGTGGLRKLRFSPPEGKSGKSGGFRVCYVFFEDYHIVYLVCVYDKHRKDDLSTAEKNAIRIHISRQKAALDRRKTI